ncbi:hypothetical protein EXN66_Car000331 [Channa argus]|uniref:Uncharacterized protein n=1 Tax=Channa argus TaxID=215402 RepID=A0A6G1QY68_CHAAH|nr:hypothetical protein EXN66_Car000331 [Channa argus]
MPFVGQEVRFSLFLHQCGMLPSIEAAGIHWYTHSPLSAFPPVQVTATSTWQLLLSFSAALGEGDP